MSFVCLCAQVGTSVASITVAKVRYERTDSFKADWSRLPEVTRNLVKDQLRAFSTAADDVAKHNGDKRRWPAALRVDAIEGARGVWAVTFSFSGPDIRATFEWDHDENGPRVVWRRIGGHPIYGAP
jgi:hypothetical protein